MRNWYLNTNAVYWAPPITGSAGSLLDYSMVMTSK
jgi:hypothetical protein